MRISIPCPEVIRLTLTNEHLNNHGAADAVKTMIEGGLLSFEIAGETPEQRLESIRDLDAELGLAIADEDRPNVLAALSVLKASVTHIETQVRHESYRQTRASESEIANDQLVISHSHAEQNASSDDSSEQHGAATTDEEKDNEQADEEEQPVEPAAGSAGGRRRR
jgi:hypothetical protein